MNFSVYKKCYGISDTVVGNTTDTCDLLLMVLRLDQFVLESLLSCFKCLSCSNVSICLPSGKVNWTKTHQFKNGQLELCFISPALTWQISLSKLELMIMLMEKA